MKLIAGLGNPEKEFDNTRHNVGFTAIDWLLKSVFISTKKTKKFTSKIFISQQHSVVLAKPQTYMNSSGIAISAIKRFYKIYPKNILIIHDDLDIPIGKTKLQYKKSPRDHKGILSIEKQLGTIDFWHLRIGVENRKNKYIKGEDYVLQNFSKKELSIIEDLKDEIIKKTIKFFEL